MQIISTMALYNYKVPIIIKKKQLHILSWQITENFQIFSRTNKQNSKTFQGCKKNPELFQNVATLSTVKISYYMNRYICSKQT